MILSMPANHPKVEVLYNPLWMILSMLVNRPNVEVLYNPLLDDPEHACKSSKGGSFV